MPNKDAANTEAKYGCLEVLEWLGNETSRRS